MTPMPSSPDARTALTTAALLGRGLFALIAALMVGGDVFGVLAALDWALLSGLGFGVEAPRLALLIALPPALAAAWYIARAVWRVESAGIGAEPAA